MSLFVAIPSDLDIQIKGFRRLKFWSQESEWIYVAKNGHARKATPDPSVLSGLVLVSLAYLEQTPTPKDVEVLIGKADGVFIHPGGPDKPTLADASGAMSRIPNEVRDKILLKTVSFSMGGHDDYKVPELSKVWSFMSENASDDEPSITGFDFDSLEESYGKFHRRIHEQDMCPDLFLQCVKLQALFCPEEQPEMPLRKKWLGELKERFSTQKGQDFFKDPILGAPAKKLAEYLESGEAVIEKTSRSRLKNPKEIDDFLLAARKFFRPR